MAITLEEFVNIIGWKVNAKELHTAEKQINETVKRMSSYGKKMFTFMTLPIAGVGGGLIKLASDSIEVKNKFNQVFGEGSEQVDKFAKELADKTGRSITDLRDGLSAYQSQMVGLGFGKEQAIEMSEKLQKLQVDFGSFHNLADKETMGRFISAMSGSAEVLDRFGVNLKANGLEKELNKMGVTMNKATEQQKAMARLNVLESTMSRQGAVGDAERTLSEFANSFRQLTSTIRDTAVAFGVLLIPTVNKFIHKITPIIKNLRNMDDKTKKLIIRIALFVAVLGPLLMSIPMILGVGKAFMTLFKIMKVGLTMGQIETIKLNLLLFAIPIIIGIVIVAIGLLVDEIRNWVKGNDSMLGKLLGSYKDFTKKIDGFFQGIADSIYNFFMVKIPEWLKSALSYLTEFFDTLKNNKFVKLALNISGLSALGKVGGLVGNGAEKLGTFIGGRNNAVPFFNRKVGGQIVNKNNISVVVPDGTTQTQATNIVTDAIKNVSQIQHGYNLALDSTVGME